MIRGGGGPADGDPSHGDAAGVPLGEYRAKRHFELTPEPAGSAASPDRRPGLCRFVVQQHDATRLHWDLRLEHEGVLLSWALPKGFPRTPDQDHLAVHTEDHPLEYLDFEGDIPEGSYGAGRMFVWDRGKYEPEKLEARKVVVELHGQRVRGRHALFAIGRGTGGRDWLVHRMDAPEDPDWQDPPEDLAPVVDTPVDVGLRVLVDARPGEVAIRTPEGDDLGSRFPEVRRIGRATGSANVVLDGVLLAEPAVLERRLAAARPDAARRLARSAPVRFVAFDVLWSEGRSLLDRSWDSRRRVLEDLRLDGPAWTTL